MNVRDPPDVTFAGLCANSIYNVYVCAQHQGKMANPAVGSERTLPEKQPEEQPEKQPEKQEETQPKKQPENQPETGAEKQPENESETELGKEPENPPIEE